MLRNFVPSSMAAAARLLVIALSCLSTCSLPVDEDTFHRSLRSSTKGYNILALGGSVTKGILIPLKSVNSYPNILGQPPNTVKNAAVKFVGSGYTSHCVETLVNDDVKYDVIVLEFTQHGHHGLDFLMQRLRLRYPDAIIIYIHLYALEREIADEKGLMPLQTGTRQPSNALKWGGIMYDKGKEVLKEISSTMKKHGGYVYELPRAKKPMDSHYMFMPDWRHLSVDGHKVVATEVSSLITKLASKVYYSHEKASLGTWSSGDQCYSWFMSGNVPVEFTGGNIVGVPLGGMNVIYAINFRFPGTIKFINSDVHPAPVLMSFMVRKDTYPKMEIELNSNKIIVDPNSNLDRNLMRTMTIGYAKPGSNEVTLLPTTGWKIAFRVTGIYVCGACLEFEYDPVDMMMHETLN